MQTVGRKLILAMPECPVCSRQLSAADTWCPACGVALRSQTSETTYAEAAPAGATRSGSASVRTADERFVPGTLLAGRYRIVTLIGRGGMGEVYQAEDLKLEQPVALKFLPASLALDAGALARFHAEVRIARQVSHPNVCRVYDIGSVDGLHFLTMEFIDGEDLSSLIRRIGRLPSDKAVEIARQLCAGLAAAHDAGVLHRDLKPANVMIDGRGRARIADFGIAAIAREARSSGVAGTPSYMAPELLQGREATVRSDIYALGLVLYELFTGKRAIEARSAAEALLIHARDSTPLAPATITDLDPQIERAILRCLEKDPARRPSAAIQVAAALPGGDLLHAALAAGETPSPEMVAAAGSAGVMRQPIALSVLAAVIVGLLVSVWIGDHTNTPGRLSMPLAPEVLAHKAREILTKVGHPEAPADWAYGFQFDNDYLTFVRNRDQQGLQLMPSRWRSAVFFWYRDSPESLEVLAGRQPDGPPGLGPVRLDNPPPLLRGMRHVLLDPEGRLVALQVVPRPETVPASGLVAQPWATALSLADLDADRFNPTDPQWFPPVAFDAVAAWTGTLRERSDVPIRAEAAAFRGRLISFQMLGPWNTVGTVLDRAQQPLQPPSAVPIVFLFLSVTAVIVAWRNTRTGRGDRRGAFRLAAFLFLVALLAWAFRIDHVANVPGEARLFRIGAAIAVLDAATIYGLYLALEPYMRRHWPQVLIGWSRVLGGRWRDPLVGREVLVGIGLGGVAFFLMAVGTWFDVAGAPPKNLDTVLGVRRVAAAFAFTLAGSIAVSLFLSFLLVDRKSVV